jgi:hypothetical protein
VTRPEDTLSIEEAAGYAKVTRATVRKLIDTYQIAHRPFPAAPLRVSKLGLLIALHGDRHALALLRAGKRDHPIIRDYADVAGVKL